MATLQKSYFTDVEVAEYLGIQSQTLRKWRAQGQGPKYVPLGRSIRYRLADVDAWLESHAVAGGPSDD